MRQHRLLLIGESPNCAKITVNRGGVNPTFIFLNVYRKYEGCSHWQCVVFSQARGWPLCSTPMLRNGGLFSTQIRSAPQREGADAAMTGRGHQKWRRRRMKRSGAQCTTLTSTFLAAVLVSCHLKEAIVGSAEPVSSGYLSYDRDHLLEAPHEHPFPRFLSFILPPYHTGCHVPQPLLAVPPKTPKAFTTARVVRAYSKACFKRSHFLSHFSNFSVCPKLEIATAR